MFKGGFSDSFDFSILCIACQKAFRECFKKDEDGKIELDFSHGPKLCASCRKKMEEKFNSSLHPDRG
jgi:hypothetical protein